MRHALLAFGIAGLIVAAGLMFWGIFGLAQQFLDGIGWWPR